MGVAIAPLIGFALLPTPPDAFEPLRKLGPTSERSALYHYDQARNPAGDLLPRRTFVDRSFTFSKMTPELRQALDNLVKSGKVKLTSNMKTKKNGSDDPEVQLRFNHQPPPSWMERQWTTLRNVLNF